MTGYGSAEGRVGEGAIFAEVRGVNSRYLDVNFKFPPNMYVLEPKVKKLIQNNVIRGKLEVFLKEKRGLGERYEIVANTALVKQYKKCLSHIVKMLGMKQSSHLLEVVDLKDLVIFRDRSVDIESLWRQIEKVIKKALSKFDMMRRKEGLAIKNDQKKRLKLFFGLVQRIDERSLLKKKENRTRLIQKAAAISCGVTENQLNEEVGFINDKSDITEEVTRLKSHIAQYRGLLEKHGPVGRQIDFLLQEMHREVNTIGSKACDSDLSGLVVESKSELEKLREQVQNVE
jgi:uncharacterized protein (TIGR00255 family)